MLGLAAAQLGYKVHIYAPDAESVAAEVTAHHSQAAWDDKPRLAAFAAACDVVTYEFENVPVDTVGFLSGHVAVRPGAAGLKIAPEIGSAHVCTPVTNAHTVCRLLLSKQRTVTTHTTTITHR